MKKKEIKVRKFLSETQSLMNFKKLFTNESALEKTITLPDLNRPGLFFSGYYEHFDNKRIQIIGKAEISFLSQMEEHIRNKHIEKFLASKPPLIIFAHTTKPLPFFIEKSKQFNIPILQTDTKTTRVIGMLTSYLEDVFSPSKTIHGNLLEVHGVGVLILGASGVGKSESSLELLERGHCLIADDVVTITKKMGRFLIGSGHQMIKHHVEVRGLGIIDIHHIYGASSIRNEKEIDIVVALEDWDTSKTYERLGLEDNIYTLLDLPLPHILIPVKPGRNIAILIEVAAASYRLKQVGIHPATQIEKKMLNVIKKTPSGANIKS
ncbi:hypothetical protein AB834_02565 [PVC group bacterium (ex Bugula neritina AB1)]|nr:hypothetical protein AB834_02565 [PVC group bacterium (ex Bugula neritina AB1)]